MSMFDLYKSFQSENGENIRNTMYTIINGPNVGGKWSPFTDISDTNDKLTIYFDLPGVDKNSIEVDFSNNKLLVSGKRIKPYNTFALKNEIRY